MLLSVVRMLINIALALAGNALGLIVAAAILDDMALDWSAFLIAVAIFTLSMVILRPLIVKVALTHAAALGGSSALISTLVALIITDLVSDGLSISGFVTWILATVIIWIISLLAAFLLPAIFLRNRAQGAGGKKAAPPQTWGA